MPSQRHFALGSRVSAGLLSAALLALNPAQAQIQSDPFWQQRIESVDVRIVNPSGDAAFNGRIEDLVRRSVGLFPGQSLSQERLLATLSMLSRNPDIRSARPVLDTGPTGGVLVSVEVTLATTDAPAGRAPAAFPTLIDADGTVVKAKVETLAMYYGNDNAWYGRPGPMLQGNPFAVGRPAGKGWSDWLEGFVHAGLYGITPVQGSVHAYGGASVIASGSTGQELFTDKTRSHVAVEDAFVGLVGGSVSEQGDRLVWNLSAGRQRFAIGDGFFLTNTSMNGLNRAALQSNPRWAADMTVLARVAWNGWKVEAFDVDPDELPETDGRTRIQGLNVETTALKDLQLGLTGFRVPTSKAKYFTPDGQFQREGLEGLDVRARWQPMPAGRSGPFVAAELARQTHRDFDMRATAWQGELGYTFAQAPTAPTISYRYARFSGDDPATTRLERWDPLFTGGNGETWVQGINHFKIFQNSNLITHRIQGRLRPTPSVELVPQVWFFRADTLLNLGGNPAFSYLSSKELGREVNLTAKYFISRHLMVQGHVAATYAGEAARQVLGSTSSPWISTMVFVRLGY